MQTLLRRIFDSIYVISGEGGWRLRPHERLILTAAIEHFGSDAQELLKGQLEQSYFVERTNKKISVLRFYDVDEDLRVKGPNFEDRWVRVHLSLNGRQQVSNVNIYRGLVFCVETRSPGKTYKGEGIKVVKVTDGKSSDTLTTAIDRVEHRTG